MINVTKTFFPPIDEYQRYIKLIWKNKWLTNRAKLVLKLEKELSKYLAVSNILLTTNGTLPIQIALNLLPKGSEIITTPFTYIATISAIVWEKHKPVFVDIHPEYLTIDEDRIEESITERTKAILAVHVFGNPCNTEIIDRIARKHGLLVIYDAAHCFGVEYKGKSIFDYGDISTTSFHATKLFHTGEGGAIFSKNNNIFEQLYYKHNFGHINPTEFYGVGINAKMSELQAAMGLAVLPYIDEIINSRNQIANQYNIQLNFTKLKTQRIRESTVWNYHYYPVIFEDEKVLIKVMDQLNKNKIYPRRYFYPSLNTLDFVRKVKMPISESIASRVLCLPLYKGLRKEEVASVCKIINENL